MTALRVKGALLSLLVVLTVLASGCASPPEAEKRAAESAVAAAKAAGAEKLVPQEFAALTAALKKAETEMSNKAYTEAKASYEAVKGLAERTVKAAEAAKAALKAEAEKQLADVSKHWEELQGRLAPAAKRLKADQREAWVTAGKTVGENLAAAKDALASDVAAAKDKLAAVVAALEKYEADLAAMAAPAKAPAKAKR